MTPQGTRFKEAEGESYESDRLFIGEVYSFEIWDLDFFSHCHFVAESKLNSSWHLSASLVYVPFSRTPFPSPYFIYAN
jgi:hypothetical protein